MKYTFETEMNAPMEKVADLAANPDNRKKWLEGLESDQPVSGTPGMPGAKSRLVFKTGKIDITMLGTAIRRNLPDEFSETFEPPQVLTTATGRFVALSPQ